MTPPSLFASQSPPNLAAPRTHKQAANNVNEGAGIRLQVHTNAKHMYTRTRIQRVASLIKLTRFKEAPPSASTNQLHTHHPHAHHASLPLQACTFLNKSRLRTRGACAAAVTAAVERRCASAPSSIRSIMGWGWRWGLSQILVGVKLSA